MSRRGSQMLPHPFPIHAQRGPRTQNDLWTMLLPKARQRLVDEGLFTPDGLLTDKGRQELERLE